MIHKTPVVYSNLKSSVSNSKTIVIVIEAIIHKPLVKQTDRLYGTPWDEHAHEADHSWFVAHEAVWTVARMHVDITDVVRRRGHEPVIAIRRRDVVQPAE